MLCLGILGFPGTSGYENWTGFELVSDSLELHPARRQTYLVVNQYMHFAAFIILVSVCLCLLRPAFKFGNLHQGQVEPRHFLVSKFDCL